MNLENAIVTVKHIVLFAIPSFAVTVADNVATNVISESSMPRAVTDAIVVKNYSAAASYIVGIICAIFVARHKITKKRKES